MDSRLQLKTFLLVYTKEKYNPLKVCVSSRQVQSHGPCLWVERKGVLEAHELGLLVLFPHLFHDADEILQAKHIASVRPIVHSRVIPEALECAVRKVNHADIHLG